MNTEDILPVIDKLSEKLGVTSDKLIEVYKGEAKVKVVAYKINAIISILAFVGSTYLMILLLGTEMVQNKEYYMLLRLTYPPVVKVGITVAGIIMFTSFISIISHLVGLHNFIEAKVANETYAVTRIMNTIFNK